MKGWAALAAALCAVAGSARAQPAADLPADRLVGLPGPGTVLGVEGGEILGHGDADFGLRAGGVARPFVVRNTLSGATVATPVAAALGVEATAAFALWDRLQLGLACPATVYQRGDRLQGVADEQPLKRGVTGDLRLHAKLGLLGAPLGGGRLTVALAPFLGIPTGDENHYGGAGHPWGEVRAAAGWHAPGWLVVSHVGLRVRPRTDFYGAREGPAGVAFGAAAAVALPGRRLAGRLEALAAVDGESYGVGRPAPIEARGGLRVRVWRGLSLAAAGGGGLDGALGAPAWRAFLEARVEPGP